MSQVGSESSDEPPPLLVRRGDLVQVVQSALDGCPKVGAESTFDAQIVQARGGTLPVINKRPLNYTASVDVHDNTVSELFAWGGKDRPIGREAEGKSNVFSNAPLSLHNVIQVTGY